jgi:HAE1 family hydrophobic/amphiphilic exporter-1
VQKQGAVTKKVSTAILLVVNLYSPEGRYDQLYLSNYAWINLKDVLARLPGVGDITIFGVGQYSMRVWLNPETLKTLSISPSDVINAIEQQNLQVPAGQVGMPPTPASQNFQYTVNVAGRLDEVEQFENIIVKIETGQGGRIIRIRDVGRVDLGAQSYSQFCTFDGKPSAGIAIYQLPGANALAVADEVRAAMERLSKNFPEGLEYEIPFDTTEFTRESIHEVYKTLYEAAILVLLVIMVFLQNFRATLVPATTVPVTIIGAFIAMAALGFTVNMVTLFALILAIGIVVDDAIVIVEGAAHHVEKGLSPKEASIKAMEQLTGPVLGITLVLMAVFLPAAFLPGITGQLYRQFALVIAATAVISAINALSLKPVQCSQYLRPPKEKLNVFYRGFNAVYNRFEQWYTGVVSWVVHRSARMMVVYLVLMAVTFWGFVSVPTGFIPEEDQGYAIVGIQLPDGSSLERTKEVTAKVDKILADTPGVAHRLNIGGISLLDNSAVLPNGAVFYTIYDDFKKRGKAELSQEKILADLRQKFVAVDEAIIFAVAPPAIQGLGVSGGFQMMLQLKGAGFDFAKLGQMTDELIRDGSAQSGLRGLNTSFRPGFPQLAADIDRIKAENLDVPLGNVFATLQAFLGSFYVNQFNKFGRTYQVYVQADNQYRLEPDDIRRLYVRNNQGKMVPVGTLADVRFETGPALITLYNLYPAAPINGQAAPGYSSGQALKLMENMAEQKLPPDMGYEWTGMAYQEKLLGSEAIFVFALASLMVFLVLAAQYESWTDPAAVILVVPLAMLGTVLALIARSYDNNVYTQIGLVLLIALASKNAILIVEVGRELRAHGMELLEAAVEASRSRLRPILMTSFAFILGVVPLAIASGAGAASRRAMGTAVIGGMLASTLIAILFVPVYFVLMQRLSERLSRRKKKVPAPAVQDAPS